MKTCFRCKKTLLYEFFNSNKTRKDGLNPYCKICNSKYFRSYRKQPKVIEARKVEHKEYRERNIENLNRKSREYKRNNPEKVRIDARKYGKRHPERVTAHNKVRHAIEKGILKREPCIICGENNAEGHHDDYSKPLKVTWLCKKHHTDLHNKKLELL